MSEPLGERGPVRRYGVSISLPITILTQWEKDHWVAEYRGHTAIGKTESEAAAHLHRILERKRWTVDAPSY